MNMFKNKSILVTGGTGSFGQSFVNFILKKTRAKKIIIFSRDELKQYEMQNKLFSEGHDRDRLRFWLGDVRDKSRLNLAFNEVDFVVHAAALKQIPAAEYNPQECINTNVNGANNVIFAALEQGVKKVVALSTDKASNPVNLYGATKLASDKLFVSANNLGGKRDTTFSLVRYGNVLNSRGSVIPFFKKLVSQNKESLPLTHEKMTRFFIKVEDGVKFVVDSFHRMKGGEIFVPKLPTIYIKDLIRSLGKNPKIVGVRPGEKLHEALCSREESHLTLEFKSHYVIKPSVWGENNKNYNKDNKGEKGKSVKDQFEYTSLSNPNVLTVPKIKALLKEIY